tara:strand:- start:33997 stop:34410 length:414 start_codon:yes stop_codon:yes gene_type:complete
VTSENSDRKEPFSLDYVYRILLWLGITSAVAVLLHFHVDKKLIAVMTLTLGLVTKAFAGLGAVVSLIPMVGPLIVKVLTLPFFWIVNGLGYFVSVIAIRKGYTIRDGSLPRTDVSTAGRYPYRLYSGTPVTDSLEFR